MAFLCCRFAILNFLSVRGLCHRTVSDLFPFIKSKLIYYYNEYIQENAFLLSENTDFALYVLP